MWVLYVILSLYAVQVATQITVLVLGFALKMLVKHVRVRRTRAMRVPDPVFYDPSTAGWYFWDETWSHKRGPFNSEDETRRAIDDYCENVLGCMPVYRKEP